MTRHVAGTSPRGKSSQMLRAMPRPDISTANVVRVLRAMALDATYNAPLGLDALALADALEARDREREARDAHVLATLARLGCDDTP